MADKCYGTTPVCIKFKSYFLFPGSQRGPQNRHHFFINVKNIIWMAQPTSTETRRFKTWMEFVRQISLKLDAPCLWVFSSVTQWFPLRNYSLSEHSSLPSIWGQMSCVSLVSFWETIVHTYCYFTCMRPLVQSYCDIKFEYSWMDIAYLIKLRHTLYFLVFPSVNQR